MNWTGKEVVQSPRTDEPPMTILDTSMISMSPIDRIPTLLPLYIQRYPSLPNISDRHSLPGEELVRTPGPGRSETAETVVAPSSPSGEPLETISEKSALDNSKSGLSDEVENLVAVTSEEYQRYERNQIT